MFGLKNAETFVLVGEPLFRFPCYFLLYLEVGKVVTEPKRDNQRIELYTCTYV